MPRCGAGARSPRRAGVSWEPGGEGGPQGGLHDSRFGASDGDKETPPSLSRTPAAASPRTHSLTLSRAPPPVGTRAPRVMGRQMLSPEARRRRAQLS